MINALRALFPPGSLFRKTGPIFNALMRAIAGQFDIAKKILESQALMGIPQESTNLALLEKEYALDLDQFSPDQKRIWLAFVKYNPINMTQSQFALAFYELFPQVYLTSPISNFKYPQGQMGVFTIGSSQCSGFTQVGVFLDAVYVVGTVASQAEYRLLRWFLERYDRAKHKHYFDIIIKETSSTSMIGVAQVGAMQIGGF